MKVILYGIVVGCFAVAGFVASALSMYNYVGWADAEAGLARLEAEL